MTYVDDGLFFARDESLVTQTIQALESKEFDIDTTMQGVSQYLGVKVGDPDEKGNIELIQPGLTTRLLKVLGLEESSTAVTPATGPLGRCLDADPFSGSFNFRSAVGMTMYLTTNTRLDCAFANHQCARFAANHPRAPHEVALKRLGRYLAGTSTRGLVIRKSTSLNLDCYVDADFAGLFGAEHPDDPTCARSRTCFLITLGGVPVLWKSQLQTLTALSTCEAEYIALSTAICDAFSATWLSVCNFPFTSSLSSHRSLKTIVLPNCLLLKIHRS